jgi:hypothetical protein
MVIFLGLLQMCMWFSAAAQDDAQTVLRLLRAKRYGDAATYADAHARLQVIAPKIGLPTQAQESQVVYYGTLVIKKVPVIFWQLLLLLCWYFFCWCMLKKQRCSAGKLSLLGLVLLTVSIPIMIGYYTDKQEVLVTAPTADLYNGPNSSLYKVGSLNRYSVATILDTKKQWYKISHDASIGWVERSAVTKI